MYYRVTAVQAYWQRDGNNSSLLVYFEKSRCRKGHNEHRKDDSGEFNLVVLDTYPHNVEVELLSGNSAQSWPMSDALWVT